MAIDNLQINHNLMKHLSGLPRGFRSACFKYWSNWAIFAAGLSVEEEKTQRKEQLYARMETAMSEFVKDQLLQDFNELLPLGATAEILLAGTFGKRTPITGQKAWEKFTKIKRDVINRSIPAWKTLYPNGIPSGMQMEDCLAKFRKAFSLSNVENVEVDSESEPERKRQRTEEYDPYYIVFILYGPPELGNPYIGFKNQGGSGYCGTAEGDRKNLSRTVQRLKELHV